MCKLKVKNTIALILLIVFCVSVFGCIKAEAPLAQTEKPTQTIAVGEQTNAPVATNTPLPKQTAMSLQYDKGGKLIAEVEAEKLPYQIDLDGDGKNETFDYELDAENNEYGIPKLITSDNERLSLTEYSCINVKIVVLDLVTTDKQYEFACIYYMDADCYGSMYSFSDGKLTDLKCEGYFTGIKDGIITCAFDADLFGSFTLTSSYVYDSTAKTMVSFTDGIWYYAPAEDWYEPMELKKDLNAFLLSDNGLKQPITVPSGTKLYFTESDRSSFMGFVSQDGTIKGRFDFTTEQEYPWYKIAGSVADDYFVFLPYAG